MQLDAVNLHVMWRETNSRIDTLQTRVNEGVGVDEASEYCRWLRFSFILKLLESAPDHPRLPCRGRELSAKVDSLIYDCGQWFARHERSNVKPPAQVPRSELEKITAQLQSLQAQISALANPQDVERQPLELRVIEGGKLLE